MCSKIRALFIISLYLFLGAGAQTQAQTQTFTNSDGGVYTYNANLDGSLTINGYSGPPWAITIPTQISNVPVSVVGVDAFVNLTQLTDVSIPRSVTNIEAQAFDFCANLTNATLFNGIINIGEEAFDGTGLRSISIPASVTNIGASAFNDCQELTNVIIPNGIIYIGADAFAFTGLLTVSIPASVTSIGSSVFTQCPNLTAIIVDPQNPAYSSLNGVLFDKKATVLLQFPEKLIENYTVPSTVTNIAGVAFENSALTSVTIPGSVANIGAFAFDACTNLTNATISDGVLSIGDYGFQDTSLNCIFIPSTVTNIGGQAFLECPFLIGINVDPQNPSYRSIDGVLFDNPATTLIQCPGGFTNRSYSVPNTVENIGQAAFYICVNLTNVVIPASVTNITGDAFAYCYNLDSVFFGGDAPAEGIHMFYENYRLNPYYLPNTKGWDTLFANTGYQPILWYPVIETNKAHLSASNGQFSFNVTNNGTSSIPIAIVSSTNLANPVWSPVQSVILTNIFHFSAFLSSNDIARFYSIRSP